MATIVTSIITLHYHDSFATATRSPFVATTATMITYAGAIMPPFQMKDFSK
jgi:hypothetical protein